jgi:hypothetical protein
VELREGMLKGKLQHERFSKIDYGGPHYSNMLKSMQGLVTFLNE